MKTDLELRGVANLITVVPTVKPKDIKKQIEDSFQRQALLEASNIKVEVSGARRPFSFACSGCPTAYAPVCSTSTGS